MPSSAFTRVAYNGDLQIYFKEFLPRSPAEQFKARLRGSRADRARRNADSLNYAGFDAPRSVYWGNLPGGGEYLYSEAVPGKPVDTWLWGTAGNGDFPLRRALLHDLGIFIGRLHATGFIHGDLRPGNLMAHRVEQRFRFWLLDNERNLRRIPAPGKMLLRNLMQLNMLPPVLLGPTDRMRFFRAWHSQMRDLDRVAAKVMAAASHDWAMRRMRTKGAL